MGIFIHMAISKAVNDNRIAGYFVPLSLFGHLFRATAAGEPGYLSHVGLNTFVDPREEGCLMNEKARNSGREIVRLMPIDGKDCLFFPSLKANSTVSVYTLCKRPPAPPLGA